MEHKIEVKVYYEDTDCLGIVYHANYLRFMERGRTEYYNSLGKPIWQLNEEGYNFVVFEMKIKFLKPAKLGDVCQVTTKVSEEKSQFRRKMLQRVESKGQLLVDAEVDIICLDKDRQLRTFPPDILE
jgi:tol-pal system-associated acyl-CoA thioesterase